MTRSCWKKPFIDNSLKNYVRKLYIKKIWSRRSTIFNNFIRNFVLIHNGKTFQKIYIKGLMINHKFGEFAMTKKRVIHKIKKKKK